jgi:hypothetical protein
VTYDRVSAAARFEVGTDNASEPLTSGPWQWTHLVATIAAGGDPMRLYVDGANTGTAAAAYSASTPAMFVGARHYNSNMPDRGWRGLVDEVRIYDRALDAQEISDLYTAEAYARPTMEVCDDIDTDQDGATDEWSPANDGICGDCKTFHRGDDAWWLCATTPASFMDATEYCEGLGAQLASVTTLGEDAWLRQTAIANGIDDTWIGLEDNGVDLWTWRDGSTFSYFDWRSAEPDDDGDCVLVTHSNDIDGGWSDTDCSNVAPFACKLAGAAEVPCVAQTPPAGLSPTLLVDADLGDDATSAPLCTPFRTITAALTAAVSGDVVWVAPGLHDDGLGEVFPLNVPDGVTLIGDSANKGIGPAPTRVVGNAIFADGRSAAVLVGADSVVEGLHLIVATAPLTYAVGTRETAATKARAVRVTTEGYGGAVAVDGAFLEMDAVDIMATSIGVACVGATAELEVLNGSSVWAGTSSVHATGGRVFVENATLNGQARITDAQFTLDLSTIEGGSTTEGLVELKGSTAGRIFETTFTVATASHLAAIHVVGASTLALSEGAKAGNNFTAVVPPALVVDNDNDVDAFSNVWRNGLTAVCGDDIVNNGAGTVSFYMGTCP